MQKAWHSAEVVAGEVVPEAAGGAGQLWTGAVTGNEDVENQLGLHP